MKKLLLSALAIGALFAQSTADLEAKIQKLEKEVKQLKEIAIQNQNKINPIAANNHLFLSYDLRTSIDVINYKLANGDKKANNIFSNRVILTGVAKPEDNLKATLKIEAHNIFGMNGNTNMQTLGYDNASWTANETPDDNTIRLKEAFFNYHFGPENALMFSAGRRPAVNGFPANLREGDAPSSPLAHLINMEFDGFSFEISNEAMPEALQNYGTWIKFCAGRGYSPNSGKFSQYPYDKDNNLKINDFAGFILVPYDDGQYALWTETVKAWNVKGYIDTNNDGMPDTMADVGDYLGFNAVFKAEGIGDGINDFLDETTAFISFATTKTLPGKNKRMLGSTDSKTGNSIWIGADMPAGENGRFGLNFVKGSKYYRSMTYGEDTLIGSIAAVRGKAYDAYYIRNITPHLSFSLRATVIKYDYTGSEAFFGDASTPMNIDSMQAKMMGAIKTAKDIRAYIRYKF